MRCLSEGAAKRSPIGDGVRRARGLTLPHPHLDEQRVVTRFRCKRHLSEGIYKLVALLKNAHANLVPFTFV